PNVLTISLVITAAIEPPKNQRRQTPPPLPAAERDSCPPLDARAKGLPACLRLLFLFAPSTADLKSLTHSWRNRVQGLQIESGTRIIGLPVPMTFRSS